MLIYTKAPWQWFDDVGELQNNTIGRMDELAYLQVFPGRRLDFGGLLMVVFGSRPAQVRYLRRIVADENRARLEDPEAPTLLAVPAAAAGDLPAFPGPAAARHEVIRSFRDRVLAAGMPYHGMATIRGKSYLLSGMHGRLLKDYILFLAQPLASIQGCLADETRRAGILAFLGLLLAGATAWFASHWLLVPLTDLDRGLIALRKCDFNVRVTPGAIEELAQVAERLNRTIDGVRDLELAKTVQEHLWPSKGLSSRDGDADPKRARGGWKIEGRCVTAADLGGDHHDWFRLPDGRLVLALGDVAGHGIPSSLIAASAYCAFLFIDLRSFENDFFRQLMLHREAWPPGLSYCAESGIAIAVFPETRRRRTFTFLDSVLIPPRRLVSRTFTLSGRRVLVSGLSGRLLNNYFLIAVRPWSDVEARQKEMRIRAGLIALLMAFLLWVLGIRLRSGVLRPAIALREGIRAMERKDFNHRVPLMTGDEWDEIAKTFNRTLEGMEELEVTRVLRSRLLPARPISGPSGVFQGRSLTSSEVGGDYYDAALRPDGGFAFIVGDAPGSGVSAALVTAMVKTGFQLLIRSGVRSPSELLSRLNGVLLNHLSKRQSMSCIAGFAEVDGTVVLAGAGFSPPRLVRPGRKPRPLTSTGNSLGVSADSVFQEQAVDLARGDHLVFCTVGVTEAGNDTGEAFGLARLDRVLQDAGNDDPERLIGNIQRAWGAHTAGGFWRDDATIAVFTSSHQ